MNDGLWAAAAAGAVCLLAGAGLIPWLQRLKLRQQIRSDGPQKHLQKTGTPTMGGLMILAALAAVGFVFARHSLYFRLALFVTLGYGALGFADDYLKVALRRPLGLRARTKLAGQIMLALGLLYVMLVWLGLGTTVLIPFTGQTVELGWLYIPFALVLILGAANGVNITDGLDGLAAGTMVLAMLAYALIAYEMGRLEIGLFCFAVAGSCAGFIFYNAHPAKVFMGDTGSLALGGALASAALLTKTELLLPIVGGVFVIETLSVMLQVVSFRLTGRRIFKMAPLHHHYELLGWSEWRVVTSFWTLAALFAAVGLLWLRWR